MFSWECWHSQITIDVNILNFYEILSLIKIHRIDLVIIGPEEPLVRLADFLSKEKLKFWPSKHAAKLEGSKAFMKKICSANRIPTAKFKICTKKTHVINFLKNCNLPIVVKADGLALAKVL